MGNSYPRYLTFKAGELDNALQQLGAPSGTALTMLPGQTGNRSRSGLLKAHSCTVSFPDGATGNCAYTRGGPAWHLFRFEHTGKDGRVTVLPKQYLNERIANTPAVIEATAQRLALAAFAAAILQERLDHFQRAVSPSRLKPATKPATKPQMSTKRAKDLAGKYALCQPVGAVGETVIPVSARFDTLEVANIAWEGQSNTSLVVACCCRWRRRWERPRFNRLHARPDYSPLTLPTSRLQSAVQQNNEETEDEEPCPGSDFVPEVCHEGEDS